MSDVSAGQPNREQEFGGRDPAGLASSLVRKSVGRHIFEQSFVYLLFVAVVCFVAVFLIMMISRERASLEEINASLDIIAPTIVREAWQVNDRGMQTILTSLIADQRVVFVGFEDENMAVSARSPLLGEAAFDWSQCHRVIERDYAGHFYSDAELPSGTLALCYQSSFTLTNFVLTFLGAGLPIMGIVLLGAAGPAFFTKQVVVDPVHRLNGYLKSGDLLPDRDPYRLEKYDGDEIDLLYQEFNTRTRAVWMERDVSNRTFEVLVDGVAVCDPEFAVQRYNPSFAALFGQGETNLLGRDVRRLLPEATFIQPGSFEEVERADGKTLHVYCRIVQGDGLPDLMIVVARDVTAQKRLEQERLQNQKMVALGTLSGGVAHDFNNLLAVISGACELLDLDAEDTEKRTHLLEEIRLATAHGRNLTSQLLTYARRSDLKRDAFPAAQLIEQTATLARRMMGSMHRLNTVLASDEYLYTDRSTLETSVLNLLLNARDALSGGGEITLTIEDVPATADEPKMVSISVHNGGPPIPSHIIGRLTEPFFTTKSSGKGTGLGLAMVAGFAKQEGGSLEITSDAQNGTYFSIKMPAKLRRPVPERVGKAMPEEKAAPMCKSVLLVEDLPNVREMTGLMIKRLGHDLQAVSGLEELRDCPTVAANPWDIVICDYALEGHTGVDVIQYLRAQGVSAPIYILSGYLSNDIADQIRSAGAEGMINKPIQIDDLRELIGQNQAAA